MRQFGDSHTHLPDRCNPVPDFREHLPGRIQNHGRNIRRLLQGRLLLNHGEVFVFDEHGYDRRPEVIPTDPMRHNTCHIEHGPINILGVY